MARNQRKNNSIPKKGHLQTGEVRIIGGDWRGRKLPVLEAEGLRPTSDRVRETLFNWLQFEVPQASCLDMFAGSGALGLEALSRGAQQVVFLELNAQNALQLRQNTQLLKANNAEIVQTDALNWLDGTTEKFDIIFVDPPFNKGLMQPAIDVICSKKCFKNNQVWLYLEQEKNLDWPIFPEGWLCHREKTTSQVKYALFTQKED